MLTANFRRSRAYVSGDYQDNYETLNSICLEAPRKWSNDGRQDVRNRNPRLESVGKYSPNELLKHWK